MGLSIFDERIACLRMGSMIKWAKEGWIQLPVVSSGLFKLSEMKMFLFSDQVGMDFLSFTSRERILTDTSFLRKMTILESISGFLQ